MSASDGSDPNRVTRLQYPGNCNGKTGTDPSKFSAEYVEYLAKSFETQTEIIVGLGDVEVENGAGGGLVDADPIYSKPHG